MADTARILPNSGNDFGASGVSVAACPPAARLVLRGAPKAFSRTLGFKLPTGINESSSEKGRHAMMLGPDEWLVIDVKAPDAQLMPKKEPKGYTAVDVSHRNTGWTVTGPLARQALAVGCPRDLRIDAFPVGACARTVFGKAEIVLLRTGREAFRVECWRSFAPYVFALLKDGARDAHL